MKDQHLDSDEDDDYFGPWKRPPRTTPVVIDRRVLPNGEIEEWERPATIPDDFIYDPEVNGYYAPGEPSGWDVEAWRREFNEDLKKLREEGGLRGTISADALRSAGAFDVPDSWRKSLGKEQTRYRSLFDDDFEDAREQGDVEPDTDDDSSADEDE